MLFMVPAAQCAFAAELATPVPSNPASTNGVGPRMQFASTVYDFGKVISGKPVEYSFIFTNTGDAMLEISGVYPSCHCTMAGPWSKQVEPGRTGMIPLVFDSSRNNGPVAKTASVICNDRSRPQIMLLIKGTVWKPFEVSPPMAVLNAVSDSISNPPATVTIVSSLEEPITLSDPVNTNAAFTAELKTVRPGKEFQLIIRTVPPLAPGTLQGSIELRTSSTNMPTIEVTAIAIVQPGLVVTPAQITLPPGPLDREVPCAVSIQNNAGPELALSEPSLNGTTVGVDIKEVVPGRQFTLMCTFPSGFQVPQGAQLNLTVKTSDPQHPVIKVPVYQGVWTGPRDIGLPALHRGPVPPASRP